MVPLKGTEPERWLETWIPLCEEMFKAIDDHIFIWMITVRNGMEGLSNKKMFFKDVASFRIRAAERVFLFIIQYRHFIMISSMRTTIMKEARSRFSQI